ncbi:hypothetical protein [Kitasatospora sp. NPDC088134]|uniref:hypothetical protein n=1 Tax=Kitasatospora sp. NPDC088134 TaxID=3364071 RepID=UPI00380D6377
MILLERLTELRQLADEDTTLPSALVDRLRQDRWGDLDWVIDTVVLGHPQQYRVLGHRVRAAAGWSVDETAINTSEPGRIFVLHPASTTWIGVDDLSQLNDRWWWGRIRIGRITRDGTLAAPSQDMRQTSLTMPGLGDELSKALEALTG